MILSFAIDLSRKELRSEINNGILRSFTLSPLKNHRKNSCNEF